jgi:hypothetical protein
MRSGEDANIRVEWNGPSSGGDGFGFKFVPRLQLISRIIYIILIVFSRDLI